MSQNRKRTLEQANNDKQANGTSNGTVNSNSNQSNDSDGPVTKRSLLNTSGEGKTTTASAKAEPSTNELVPPMRFTMKSSNKPVQSINLPVSKLDEELCYIAVSPVK